MFNFLGMMDNYEDRCVGNFRDEDKGLFVSTAEVTDGDHQYETAIEHPRYDNGNMIIVEAYDTREQAEKRHDDWVEMVKADTLPDPLQDCQNSGVSQFLDADDLLYSREA